MYTGCCGGYEFGPGALCIGVLAGSGQLCSARRPKWCFGAGTSGALLHLAACQCVTVGLCDIGWLHHCNGFDGTGINCVLHVSHALGAPFARFGPALLHCSCTAE